MVGIVVAAEGVARIQCAVLGQVKVVFVDKFAQVGGADELLLLAQCVVQFERVKAELGNGNGFGMPLGIAVAMLPTPSVADTQGGRKSRSGERNGELLLNGIAHASRWGEYAAAIASHERLTGRPAPNPTEPGPRGNPRLSAAFCEWMMCLPAGWVTDCGITRNQALKALGNGVAVPQAAHALRVMLARMEAAA